MAKVKSQEVVTINAPNFGSVTVHIIGTSPYVQNKMSADSLKKLLDKFLNGEKASTIKKVEPKILEEVCAGVTRIDINGVYGIPSIGMKSALIRAASLCGMEMKRTKLSIDIDAPTFDRDDGMPLLPIRGKPKVAIHYINSTLGNNAALTIRPMWEKWAVDFVLTFDKDLFTTSHIMNLVHRAGMQVGIGSGRPDSKGSAAGLGWGKFRIATPEEINKWEKLKF